MLSMKANQKLEIFPDNLSLACTHFIDGVCEEKTRKVIGFCGTTYGKRDLYVILKSFLSSFLLAFWLFLGVFLFVFFFFCDVIPNFFLSERESDTSISYRFRNIVVNKFDRFRVLKQESVSLRDFR